MLPRNLCKMETKHFLSMFIFDLLTPTLFHPAETRGVLFAVSAAADPPTSRSTDTQSCASSSPHTSSLHMDGQDERSIDREMNMLSVSEFSSDTGMRTTAAAKRGAAEGSPSSAGEEGTSSKKSRSDCWDETGSIDTLSSIDTQSSTDHHRKDINKNEQIRVYPNGDVYCGQLMNEMRNGTGKMIYSQGGEYEGDWLCDQQHGYGTYANEDWYEGEFQDGKRHGTGTMTYCDDMYTGMWEKDKKNGHGTYEWHSGDVYGGDFCDGQMHGTGTMVYSNGDKYDGEWTDGWQCGQGCMQYANGDKCEGHWELDERCGSGKLTCDGVVFEGQWEGNNVHVGVCKYSNGFWYVGSLRNYLRNGSGAYHYENGDVYSGDWRYDLKHGSGVFKSANGRSVEGEWANDIRVPVSNPL